MTIQNISTHLSNIIPRVLKMILIMFLLGLAAVLIVALAKISYELFMMALGPAPIVPNQLAELRFLRAYCTIFPQWLPFSTSVFYLHRHHCDGSFNHCRS